jgi:NADH-quinone oxidoreductase subunit N
VGGSDFVALLPLILTGLASVVVMLVASFRRDHDLALVLTVSGFALSVLALLWASSVAPRQVTPLLLIDRLALFYMALLFLASIVVAALAHGYLENRPGQREEFYMLLLMATLGGAVLAASTHFASLFVGLELLTLSLYGMIGYTRTNRRSIEAAVKYLILAGVSAAFLLFGMALVYAELGTMEFSQIISAAQKGDHREPVLLAGMAMIVIGAGFKLALVPFHMWTPDVYEGAPAPVTAYVATVSKGAMTAVLLRLYLQAGGVIPASLASALTLIAILSMFTGNLLALLQNNVKRILAYSSIAHLGYMLVAFLAGGAYAGEAVTYYLVAYMVTSLGTFGIVSVLSNRNGEAETLEDYRGLFWKQPIVAGVFTAMLLSLAGIPMTAGFIGKFYLVAAGVDGGVWGLLASLVINSALGLFYYLRIVASMYASDEAKAPSIVPAPVALAGGIMLGVLALALVWLGVFPSSLIGLIRSAVSGAA